MIISRKKYNRLIKEIEGLRGQLSNERTNNEKLRNLYEKIKTTRLETNLKNYQYAILVDEDYRVRVFNEGRFEKYKCVEFQANYCEIPMVILTK